MGKPYYPDYHAGEKKDPILDAENETVNETLQPRPLINEKEVQTKPAVKTIVSERNVLTAYALADALLTKRYIGKLNQLPVIPMDKRLADIPVARTVRLYRLERIVYDVQENNQEKLMNVYHALYSCGGSAIVVVQSDGSGADFYLGVRASDLDTLVASKDVLQKAIYGNFPGTQMSEPLLNPEIEKVVQDTFAGNGKPPVIASITGIPAFREQNGETGQKGFVQGLERLIDAMYGEKYNLLIIADPVRQDQLDLIRRSYENLYTQLAPLAQLDLTSGKSESRAINEVLTKGISHGISNSLSQMSSVTKSQGQAHTKSKSHTDSKSSTWSVGIGGGLNGGNAAMTAAGALAGCLGTVGGVVGSVIPGVGTAVGAGVGSVLGGVLQAVIGTSSAGGSVGISAGYGRTKGHADTTGSADTVSKGKAFTRGNTETRGTTDTTSRSQSSGTTDSQGTNQSQQIHFVNKTVQGLMKQIDRQLERLDDCNDIGVWNYAAYVIADDVQTSQVVASTYQSLLRGENSGIEMGAITVWNPGGYESDVEAYLRRFCHPMLELDSTYSQVVTPATYISGKELTIAAGFPQKSVPGLPAETFAPFGREVIWQGKVPSATGRLGNIYHMGQADRENYVDFDLNRLMAHTFITGSTGSGKSNAVYELLYNFQIRNVPWLVIEPAKGEYKDVFGGYGNVNVYGTNPRKYPYMLQLNPFSFPDDVHVLEHVDRLVEIFNACWPMYAAMPAILREAIEKSYEACGWNLKLSLNPGRFPTFATLLQILPKVVDSSAYSADTTNDYKGALVTRVRSLTRGIHGLIFQNDIDMETLLGENAIIDLSRIGSQETKSLLMGILTLKLQEYRMSEDSSSNSNLRHVTVLEEAHNLLRRTSDVQIQESANLQGESVAMIANAIAEMRTYGEGFVIVDQSPGLIDPSVIRNTNTKIILRLPDKNDRDLVGKAAGLTEEQIDELANLECGIAAVYQSGWEEAVLCSIRKFEAEKAMQNDPVSQNDCFDAELRVRQKFIIKLMNPDGQSVSYDEASLLQNWQYDLKLSTVASRSFLAVLEGKVITDQEKVSLLRYILHLDNLPLRGQIVARARKQLEFYYGFTSQDKIIEKVIRLLMDVLPESLSSTGE